jgi:hypothetical protein
MSLRIDRASFLSFTFGLSGLACNTGSSAVAAGVVDIPLQPPPLADAGPSGSPVATSEDASTKLRPPSLSKTDDPDDDDDVGTATDEGGGRIAGSGTNQGCGFVDPKTVTRPPAGCNDDQGTAGSCNVMKTCKGFAFPKQKCEAYRRFLKPKVAQKALDCLAKLTVKQTCDDACTTYRCGDLAIKTACSDPSADASCTQITRRARPSR